MTIDRRLALAPPATSWPHRGIFVIVEALISLSALAGSVRLFTAGAPLQTELPAGLPNGPVSGLWLFALVAVPSALAAWFCWRRSTRGPIAVLIASAALAVDVVAQIPFVGFNVLQLVFGLIAAVMVVLALAAQRRGWSESVRLEAGP